MSASRPTWTSAAQELAARDQVMAGLVAAAGLPRLRPRRASSFEALARAIVFQQLSGIAAGTIWGRVEALLGSPVTPEAVLATSVEALRAAGLSGAKTAALIDLSEKVGSGGVPLDRRLTRLSDDELVSRLVVVRGIGRWTAEMFLIFSLGRPDVLPVDDLGFRAGVRRHYGLDALPTAAALRTLAEPWRPYRTFATWYLWRSNSVDPRVGVPEE